MFEARLIQGSLLKKILESMKDLVTEAIFHCTDSGISVQAMDSSHVCLVSLLLRAEGFDPYRCDRNVSLGIHIATLTKVMKCASTTPLV